MKLRFRWSLEKILENDGSVKKMKYAAAITLYNPTEEQIKHCQEYKESFDCVYICDNSDKTNSLIKDSFASKEFKYIRMNGNEGLPKAFNAVLDNETIHEYDYLCTLDQDSVFHSEDIFKMRSFIEECSLSRIEGIKYHTVGIFAPVIDYGRGFDTSKQYEERQRVITSGSFINLDIVKRQQLRYDELYFIDKFEIDFCQKMILEGDKIIVYFGSKLEQQLGDGDRRYHSTHNYLRHYYLFRNRFYYNKKFYSGLKRICLNILQTARQCIEIIGYEPEKKLKLKQLCYGYNDYKNGKMGKRA